MRQFTSTSISICHFNQSISCNLWSDDDDTYSKGSVSISKIDRNLRIVSGTFEATLYKVGCDTIRITNGRFDMRF